MISAGRLIPALREAGLTSSEIGEVTRALNAERNGVRQLRDEIAMQVLDRLLAANPVSGMSPEQCAQALDMCVKWAYFTADRAMTHRAAQEPKV